MRSIAPHPFRCCSCFCRPGTLYELACARSQEFLARRQGLDLPTSRLCAAASVRGHYTDRTSQRSGLWTDEHYFTPVPVHLRTPLGCKYLCFLVERSLPKCSSPFRKAHKAWSHPLHVWQAALDHIRLRVAVLGVLSSLAPKHGLTCSTAREHLWCEQGWVEAMTPMNSMPMGRIILNNKRRCLANSEKSSTVNLECGRTSWSSSKRCTLLRSCVTWT